MPSPDLYLPTFVESEIFETDAARIFTEAEVDALFQYLAEHPEAGDIVPGAGGVRKLRWGAKGQGKRGGSRVIYFYRSRIAPIYMLAVNAKNEKSDLSAQEKKYFVELVGRILRSEKRSQ